MARALIFAEKTIKKTEILIKKYNKVTLDKRKTERECLPEFFKKHIEIAKKKCCEECGTKLKGHISEIAHILPKGYFKSVMCNDLNVNYLCGLYSNNNCHNNFDNFPQEKVKEMKIYPKVQEVFKQLEEEITEKINYKHRDLYE
jgi:hypothetical protein